MQNYKCHNQIITIKCMINKIREQDQEKYHSCIIRFLCREAVHNSVIFLHN